jgi:hypothetical protein
MPQTALVNSIHSSQQVTADGTALQKNCSSCIAYTVQTPSAQSIWIGTACSLSMMIR